MHRLRGSREAERSPDSARSTGVVQRGADTEVGDSFKVPEIAGYQLQLVVQRGSGDLKIRVG